MQAHVPLFFIACCILLRAKFSSRIVFFVILRYRTALMLAHYFFFDLWILIELLL